MGDVAGATSGRSSDWVAPEQPSAPLLRTTSVIDAGPRTEPTDNPVGLFGGDSSSVDHLGPSTGIAVARGDARAGRRGTVPGAVVTVATNGEDPAVRLVGNPLRSLGVAGPGAVLDQAFDLLRFRFRRWVALAAVLFIPVQLVDLAIALTSGSTATTTSAEGLSQFQLIDGTAGTSGWSWMVLGLQSLALFLLGMAAGHLVTGWLDGRDDPFGTVVGAVARRVWVAPLVVIPTVAAKSMAACFGGVGFFLVDALFFIAGPVAGAEVLGPGSTLARSVRLARRSYGQALVIAFGGFCITSVLRVALGAGPLVLVSMLGLPSEWLVAIDQATSVTLLITMPLTACIAARAHVDLRCRAEGFDLVRREVARGLR